MTAVLQTRIPHDPTTARSLPGVQPLRLEDWLIRDEAFAGQMAERDRLLRDHPDRVLGLDDNARAAACELLDLVLGLAYPEQVNLGRDNPERADRVIRPDGAEVIIDRAQPMATLGRLVQEDLCILQKIDDEHVLTGAVLCFPASWTLSEKFMKPLVGIHVPVASYDAGIAARVQRLFDGVQSGRPLWRFNALWYADPDLHQPRREGNRRQERHATVGNYMRSERQSILRLPVSGAVVFSIHTYVLARADIEATYG